MFFLFSLLVETLWFIAKAMTTITRRKPVSTTTTSGSGAYSDSASNSNSQSNPQDREDRDRDDERDNDDDKETRLTLMEEVLLLGLKDREVGALSSLSCAWKQRFCPSGLYIILERLYFVGSSWVHSCWVGFPWSSRIGEDRRSTKNTSQSQSDATGWYSHRRRPTGRSFTSRERNATTRNSTELDWISQR